VADVFACFVAPVWQTEVRARQTAGWRGPVGSGKHFRPSRPLTRDRQMNDRSQVSTESPFRSANEAWVDRVRQSGDSLAYRYRAGGAWQDVSWKQADEMALEVAAGLAALGLLPVDRVALLSQTRFEWMLCDIGILIAGAVTVPVYPSSTADQCAYIVRNSNARAVFVEDAAQLDKLVPLLLTGADLYLVHFGGDGKLDRPDAEGRTEVRLDDVLARIPREAARRVLSLEHLRKLGRGWLEDASKRAQIERRRSGAGPDDMFTIIYTSGTTGNPKGVVLTHGNLISAVVSACRALGLKAEGLHYLWVPLAHVVGREIAWASIFAGLPVVFSEGLTRIKDNLLEVRPSFMAGVPRVYEKFYAAVKAGMQQGSAVRRALVAWAFRVGARYSAEVRQGRRPGAWLSRMHGLADKLVLSKLRAKLGLDRCRLLISGGAPLAAEIGEFFHAAGLLILEGYGLTETMAAAFLNRIDRYRFGTVGLAIDVVDCKIAADGEILLRGPSVFHRYHDDAAATAEAIDAEGWFHTGDIGELEDGFLRITDRKKDLIVLAGGKKVAPQVLENALKARCPLLSQVLVFGDRKPYCVALVTLGEEAISKFGGGDPGRAARDPQLRALVKKEIDALNASLASFETIKHFGVLGEDFTEANGQLTPSLKVKRKEAVSRHRAAIEGLYDQPVAG
jgi:long-chain acyl-CoA synthetase